MIAYDDHLKQLKSLGSDQVGPQTIENMLQFAYSFYQNEVKTLNLPDFPIENIGKLVQTLKSVQREAIGSVAAFDLNPLIKKIYPYDLLFKNDDSDLKLISSLAQKFKINLDDDLRPTNEVVFNMQRIDFDRNLVFSTVKDPKTELKIKLPDAANPVGREPLIEYHSSLLVDMCMWSCGSPDMALCLVGERGSGKTTLFQNLAETLGYSAVSTLHLYKDMNSRDLLQQRVTDLSGNTRWANSVLVDACLNGN
jgi:hypothetical protein